MTLEPRKWLRMGAGHPVPVRIAIWTAIAVAALFVLYLSVANLVLMRALLPAWVSETEDLSMSYDSAYTLYPGRVHLTGLSVRGADYNIQFELTTKKATLDVDLLALANKRLEGSDVEVAGVSFSLRHRVHSVEGQRKRIAAFPDIAGFEGPPLYEGPPPESSPEQRARTWAISLSDIVAEVTQLWIVEYRFAGRATATGAFEFRSGSDLRLSDATLAFESGDIHVGEALVAANIGGKLSVSVRPTKLWEVKGRQIFDRFSANVQLEAEGGDLEFSNVYFEDSAVESISGPFHAQLNVRVHDGDITSDTEATLYAPESSVRTRFGSVTADVRVHVEGTSEEAESIALSLDSERLDLHGSTAPSAEGVEVVAGLQPLDLTESQHVDLRSVRVAALRIPDLGWLSSLKPGDLELSGSTHAELAWQASGGGHLHASSAEFGLSSEGFAIDASGADLVIELGSAQEAKLAAERVDFDIDELRLRYDGKAATATHLKIDSTSLRFHQKPSYVQGTLDVSLNGAHHLLTLTLPDISGPLAKALAGVDELQARVAVYVGGKLTKVELLQARSGAVGAQGAWQKTSGGSGAAVGKFAFDTDAGNIGLRLGDDGSDITVGITPSEFLKQHAPVTNFD